MNECMLLTPALKCAMGDWTYYSALLNFAQVAECIKRTEEIHESQQLSNWIQRQLIQNHASNIAEYLLEQPERFFNAIVVGVYGGAPSWHPLEITVPRASQHLELTEGQQQFLQTSVGILHFTGTEKLFAIDGQHRVEGIKKAWNLDPGKIKDDELTVIFVSHEKSQEGERRTRRLFTTLNKTARRVSTADRIALDEDDGFAVLTRRLVDEFSYFKQGTFIAFNRTASLKKSDRIELTTIVSLYNQIVALYQPQLLSENIAKKRFKNARPADSILDQYFEICTEYWYNLRQTVSEVDDILSKRIVASELRQESKNHLLARPIGQHAFAKATGILVGRGHSLQQAIERLTGVELWLHQPTWHFILWDPLQGRMEKNVTVGVSMLLYLIGEEAQTKATDAKLKRILEERPEIPQ